MVSDVAAFVLSGIALILAGAPLEAAAHAGAAGATSGNAQAWAWVLALLLAASAALYAVGVRRLWRRAGARRGLRGGHVLAFCLGWLVLAGALFSPIDALADRSFALHMAQHELLMLVAAPLFVLARPLEAWTWALAQGLRRRAHAVTHAPWARRAWRAIAGHRGAWCLHASALWIWHVPTLFVAAADNPSLHVLQHACFFGSALLFWWSVLRHRTAGALFSVFTTMLHTGALGALLSLAPHPWYLAPAQSTVLGMSALEDQQLGGLVMWVPGSLAYLLAGLGLVAGWLSPMRARHHVA